MGVVEILLYDPLLLLLVNCDLLITEQAGDEFVLPPEWGDLPVAPTTHPI
jgi:hypothetical protein